MCDNCIFRDPKTGICNITNTLATYPLECAAYKNRKEEYREIMKQFYNEAEFFDRHHPGFSVED